MGHHLVSIYIFWLVVSTPLKNISQLGWLSPIYGKIKHVPNHHLYIHICYYSLSMPQGKGRSERSDLVTGDRASCSSAEAAALAILQGSKAPRSGLVGKVFCSCSIETTKKHDAHDAFCWCLLMFVDAFWCLLNLVDVFFWHFWSEQILEGHLGLQEKIIFGYPWIWPWKWCESVAGGCLIGKKDCRVNPMGSQSHFQYICFPETKKHGSFVAQQIPEATGTMVLETSQPAGRPPPLSWQGGQKFWSTNQQGWDLLIVATPQKE